MENNKALLVIDMQKGAFTPKTPRYDTEGTVDRINSLAELFRERKSPVFYIQHDGTGSGAFEKNTQEWEILDALDVTPSDILIDKYANDIFYQSKLESYLVDKEISELVVTGCATDFCVESTIQSGLSKDYNITVVADAHTTGDRPHMKADQVIAHYNWVWQNMIPTQGRVVVKPLHQIKTEMNS